MFGRGISSARSSNALKYVRSCLNILGVGPWEQMCCKMARRNQHVVPHDGEWAVRGEIVSAPVRSELGQCSCGMIPTSYWLKDWQVKNHSTLSPVRSSMRAGESNSSRCTAFRNPIVLPLFSSTSWSTSFAWFRSMSRNAMSDSPASTVS